MKRKNPWMVLSLALAFGLVIILLLCGPCGPCGPCRDGRPVPDDPALIPEPSPVGGVDLSEGAADEAAKPRRTSRSPGRPARDLISSPRRVVPAPVDDTMEGSSKHAIAPTEEKTEPEERETIPEKISPPPVPDPSAPEEYDFRTRLEIITGPAK